MKSSPRWSWIVAGVGLALLTGAAGVEAQDQRTLGQVQAEANALDTKASRVAGTPEGQRRVAESLAAQFKVDRATVEGLRDRRMGWGEVAIALALSQELMKQNPTLTQDQALAMVLSSRESGGWGKVAQQYGLKLGPVLSGIKQADKRVAGLERERGDHGDVARTVRADKVERHERPNRPERPEKVERPERPDKPEKPERLR
jgi:hypothetical protein